MAESSKTLIIMRGLPGSGKSTKAQALGEGGVVFSTDEFWGPEYNFDNALLAQAHRWNENRAKKAMREGLSPIVIDNVNSPAYAPKPYVQAAIAHGYDVRFEEAETDWRWDVDQLFERNTHNVPKEVIQEMKDMWEPDMTVEKALKAVAPWEKSED